MEGAESVVENGSARAQECLEKNFNLSDNFCPAYYDGLLCWDPTPWYTLAVQKCFSEFHGVQYDDTREYTNRYLIVFFNYNIRFVC